MCVMFKWCWLCISFSSERSLLSRQRYDDVVVVIFVCLLDLCMILIASNGTTLWPVRVRLRS